MKDEIQAIIDIAKSAPSDWDVDKWRIELDRVVPNWKDIVKNPNYWEDWEDDEDIVDSQDLLYILIDGAGYYLAERWLETYVDICNDSRANAAYDWAMRYSYDFNSFGSRAIQLLLIQHNIKTVMNVLEWDTWAKMDLALKVEIINQVLKITDNRCPLTMPERNRRIVPDIESFEDRLEAIGAQYFQYPAEIEKLMSFLNREKTPKLLNLFDSKFNLRKRSLRNFIADFFDKVHFRFVPQNGQNSILREVFELADKIGFSIKKLPGIYYSYELPPMILMYPQLFWDDREELRDENGRLYADEDEFREAVGIQIKHIGIDGLLGCYKPETQEIFLYVKGMEDIAKRSKQPIYDLNNSQLIFTNTSSEFDTQLLFTNITLVNLLARWIMHQAPSLMTAFWHLEDFILTDEDVYVTLSMLFAYWVFQKLQEKDLCREVEWSVFLEWMPPKYQLFEEFADLPPQHVLSVIESLRKAGKPAAFNDLKELLLKNDSKTSETDEESDEQ